MVFARRRFFSAALVLSVGIGAACDGGGGTEPSLVPPTGVAATSLTPSQVEVRWSPVSGATSYRVERAPGQSGGAFAEVGTATDSRFEDNGLDAVSTYRYRIAAVRGGQTSEPSQTVAVTTRDRAMVIVSSNITSNRTFSSDTVYQLSGFIQVANGATLTIQPGTRILGDYDVPGSSLFILRGAKIHAEGTAERPIVFTSERPVGERRPGDWGGVIIIGNGVINRGAPTYIEGTGTSAANPLQDYSGGNNNNDDSGILRYVRIEYAGFPVRANEELNSLTMAAVGRGTRIEYVQILLGLDDSFEWFGGAVDGRYLISYESGDDHFDASEGYVGRNQYMIAFQSIQPEARSGLAGGVATDPQGIENDGCWAENCNAGNNNRSASQPYTVPVFANFTLIGAPQGAWESSSGNFGAMLRRGTGGLYVNGVIARYSRDAIALRGQETKNRIDDGLLGIRNVLVTDVRNVFEPGSPTASDLEARRFTLDMAASSIEQSQAATGSLFAGLPTTSVATTAADFDWTPSATSALRQGGLNSFAGLPQTLRDAAGTFVTPTTFRGAADPNGPKWWQGWTYYAQR